MKKRSQGFLTEGQSLIYAVFLHQGQTVEKTDRRHVTNNTNSVAEEPKIQQH